MWIQMGGEMKRFSDELGKGTIIILYCKKKCLFSIKERKSFSKQNGV